MIVDLHLSEGVLTNRIGAVIESTQNRVKINTKLTNFMKLSRIKKYSGE